MTLVFIVNTPAQAHAWKNTMGKLLDKGHEIRVVARNYGSTPDLIRRAGFECDVFDPVGSRFLRFLGTFEHLHKCYSLAKKYSPAMVIGFGADAAVTSKMLGIPCIVFVDDENTNLQNKVTHALSTALVTPDTFAVKLGSRHVLLNSYKELAYLHPNYFTPDPSIYDELGIDRFDRYVILRFNVFDAVHDIGARGFTVSDQIRLTAELRKHARVFVSHEGRLPDELADCRLPIAPTRIHDALFYAQLLVTDTQTMTTEAAVLGTPAVRSNSFVGPRDIRTFVELERKYDLIYSFDNPERAVEKAIELVKNPDAKGQWAFKRKRLLAEKADFTEFMVDFIVKYIDEVDGAGMSGRGQ